MYFLVLKIQGYDMIGIDICFAFFAVEAAGSDGNITSRRRKQALFFLDMGFVDMAVLNSHITA